MDAVSGHCQMMSQPEANQKLWVFCVVNMGGKLKWPYYFSMIFWWEQGQLWTVRWRLSTQAPAEEQDCRPCVDTDRTAEKTAAHSMDEGVLLGDTREAVMCWGIRKWSPLPLSP